jgi:hypothetical protein
VSAVTKIAFEYSPGRSSQKYTADRTAFDVYLEHATSGGGRGFIALRLRGHPEPEPTERIVLGDLAAPLVEAERRVVSCSKENPPPPPEITSMGAATLLSPTGATGPASVIDGIDRKSPSLSPPSEPGRAIVERELADRSGGGAAPSASPPFECRTGIARKENVFARFNTNTMVGTVAVDAPGTLFRSATVRRIRVRAAPHAATYALLFSGYETEDKTPKHESLIADQSIVARAVADGENTRLYFDGDLAPPLAPPAGFFLCER